MDNGNTVIQLYSKYINKGNIVIKVTSLKTRTWPYNGDKTIFRKNLSRVWMKEIIRQHIPIQGQGENWSCQDFVPQQIQENIRRRKQLPDTNKLGGKEIYIWSTGATCVKKYLLHYLWYSFVFNPVLWNWLFINFLLL